MDTLAMSVYDSQEHKVGDILIAPESFRGIVNEYRVDKVKEYGLVVVPVVNIKGDYLRKEREWQGRRLLWFGESNKWRKKDE